MFAVQYSVKGAQRISRREFATHPEAEAFAARWRRSNSTGDYRAVVQNAAGHEVCKECGAEIVADGEFGPVCANGHDGLPPGGDDLAEWDRIIRKMRAQA